MLDAELIAEILSQIENAISIVRRRFSIIHSTDDFLNTPEGLEKLDSIGMKLIAIGESVNNLDKHTKGALLQNYPDIDLKGVKGVRDIISHHYFDLDAEEIFNICDIHLPSLHTTIRQMICDQKS
ncbi:MAG: HepT-like ribonuclease domain-containing protein [Sedimenticola sp.]